MFDVEFEVNKIIAKAVEINVSDIHFEPLKNGLIIKFRIDGLLQVYQNIDKKHVDLLINRIKVMSNIDIGEKRLPQDGRWGWTHKGKRISLRVATMPTIHGEKIVIRILGNKSTYEKLTDLGMTKEMATSIRKIIKKPNGLILVSGPTGAGKSSTLYAILSEMIEMNNKSENIICLENPVEYEIQGATQVEINEKSGLTFAAGLRAGLRQDPDVIMVGEIRDYETAKLAIQSALTGHKVLSTIHTNNSIGVVERLIDMGIELFLVKAALSAVIAQRLVRRPCEKCRHIIDPNCFQCRGSGYKGRVGVYELLVTPTENNMWDSLELFVHPTLLSSGTQLLKEGKTTLEELQRVGIDISTAGRIMK